MAGRDQPETCRGSDMAKGVPLRTDLHDRWAWLDRTGTDLGAGQIHLDLAMVSSRSLSPVDPCNHLRPHIWAVMCAVYASTIHSTGDKLVDKSLVRCSLGGKSHHDPDTPSTPGRAEQHFEMVFQQGLPSFRARAARPSRALPMPRLLEVKPAKHRVEVVEYMALGSTKRREPALSQERLVPSQIETPECEVVQEVARAILPGAKLGNVDSSFKLQKAGPDGFETSGEKGCGPFCGQSNLGTRHCRSPARKPLPNAITCISVLIDELSNW